MSAGHGIQHSEMNHSTTEPVHFVQMWVVPDTPGVEPGYEQLDVNDRLAEGGLQLVAAGDGRDGAIHIHQRNAAMWVGRLAAGEEVALPDAPFVHVFVARGEAALGDTRLRTGDAARITDADALTLTAATDAEVIVWESSQSVSR
jgi:redox-sensitive bicupin YhaK (pirin superfamily)